MKVYYFDKKYKIIFDKTIYDWEDGYSNHCKHQVILNYSTLIDDYIVVAANSNQSNYLLLLDKTGNVVDDFSSDIAEATWLSIEGLQNVNNGVYVSLEPIYYYCPQGASEIVNPNVLGINNSTKTLMIYYSAPYEIIKNIEGKGKIETTYVKAQEGTLVQFTVTPEPGYVLSMVKVIDANGNVLTFTDNTFVMPASNVTIEAIFVPKNPNTGDIAILTITLFALASAFILLTQKKKLDFLK